MSSPGQTESPVERSRVKQCRIPIAIVVSYQVCDSCSLETYEANKSQNIVAPEHCIIDVPIDVPYISPNTSLMV